METSGLLTIHSNSYFDSFILNFDMHGRSGRGYPIIAESFCSKKRSLEKYFLKYCLHKVYMAFI